MDELRRRGYVEGRNLIFEHRVAEGQLQLLPELARDLGNAKVDVILTLGGTRSILSAKNEVPSIPAVMELASDPVRAGIVSSLANPGGNVTGNAIFARELGVKRYNFLRTQSTSQSATPFSDTVRIELGRIPPSTKRHSKFRCAKRADVS